MGIVSEQRSGAGRRRRTTLALPEHLLDMIDREVEAGNVDSRAALIAEAIQREMKRRERLSIDENLRQMRHDARYLAEQEAIMAEFASADAETAAVLPE